MRLAAFCIAAATTAITVGAAIARDEPTSPARLFEANCAGCHAPGGRAPTLDQAFLVTRTQKQLRDAIRHGLADGAMPAFGATFSAAAIDQLVRYLGNRADAPHATLAAVDGQVVASAEQRFRVEVIARGLDTPWGLAFLPDGRLLVTERPGRLRIVDRIDKGGRLLATPVAGTPAVWVKQDAGLMDVATHRGWVYLTYAEVDAGGSMTVVSRGRIVDDRWTDAQQIFRAPSALYTKDNSHYGSRLAFDRAGFLYYSIGDRGVSGHAQDLTSPLGKLHRVHADGRVPRDNPFVGRAGAVPTIWSWGHRNPQGMAWSPATGLMWESEHGPNGGDEINIVERGRNYGWGLATMGTQAGMPARAAPGTEGPVAFYTPRIAPSGIAFVSSGRYPGWQGNLMVAGLAGHQLRRLEVDGRRVVAQEVLLDGVGRIRAVMTGPDGLLYVLAQTATGQGTPYGLTEATPGIVLRLVPLGGMR